MLRARAGLDRRGFRSPKLFPVKWKSMKTAEGSIDKWEFDKNGAHALLDSGKTGEVKLKAFPGIAAGRS